MQVEILDEEAGMAAEATGATGAGNKATAGFCEDEVMAGCCEDEVT